MKNTARTRIAAIAAALCILMTGCSAAASNSDTAASENTSVKVTAQKGSSVIEASASYLDDEEDDEEDEGESDNDLFTGRDLEQTADTSEAQSITVADGETIDITEAGVYVISGTATECTIRVEADKEDKVQLVLDGVSITNSSSPAIYVVSADKCFITTTDSENTLSVTGEFEADGDTNTDAVIYSKEDIVLNGTGTLTIVSSQGNGVSAKDDLKITGGTYNITSGLDSIEVKDSILISDGTFTINSSNNGIQCKNSDDDTLGSIYISGGSFDITAASDGIQAVSFVQIDGGTFNINSAEGIEATYIQINDGTINITASDDGINATQNSSAYEVVVEFNGGYTTISMGQGDTDAVDANGSIYVNGGTIDITAPTSSFDYDGTAEFNGGTIIINGEEVSEIPAEMMGGGGMGGRGGFGGGRGF